MSIDPDRPPQDFRDALYTVDRSGRRTYVFADIAGGVWRRRRVVVSILLIGFYLALPFIEVNGGPLLRIDLGARRYTVAGFTFWPQDLMYLLLFALIALLGTLCMVALFGRVFCGWLCPHNVFLEMVYRPIEQWLEGRGHRRFLIHKRGPDGAQRLRKILKWGIYMVVTGALANTATALFVGTDAFIAGLIIDPVEHPVAAVVFAVFMAVNLFNFGWFRELTCTFVCPYGRMQAAMLDQHTLGVAYDGQRGEPRGRPDGAHGDCVDCGRCVQVCPTGIDIRNGNQLECIHCTACIDACDAVMARLGRDPGLIRYSSDVELGGGRRRVLRPRTVFYSVVLAALFALLTALLLVREPVQVTRLRDDARLARGVDEAGARVVRKMLKFDVFNRDTAPREVRFTIPDQAGAKLIGRDTSLTVASGERREVVLFLELPAAELPPAVAVVARFVGGERRLPIQVVYQ